MAYNGHNWVNDGPPAINAQNLNEMDEELVKLEKNNDNINVALNGCKDDLQSLVGLFEFSWEQGGLMSATGIEYNSTSNVRTIFKAVSGARTVIVSNKNTSGSNAALFEFADNQETASGVNERLKVTYIAPNTSRTITLTENTAYIRCQVPSANISDGENMLVYTFNSILANDYNTKINAAGINTDTLKKLIVYRNFTLANSTVSASDETLFINRLSAIHGIKLIGFDGYENCRLRFICRNHSTMGYRFIICGYDGTTWRDIFDTFDTGLNITENANGDTLVKHTISSMTVIMSIDYNAMMPDGTAWLLDMPTADYRYIIGPNAYYYYYEAESETQSAKLYAKLLDDNLSIIYKYSDTELMKVEFYPYGVNGLFSPHKISKKTSENLIPDFSGFTTLWEEINTDIVAPYAGLIDIAYERTSTMTVGGNHGTNGGGGFPTAQRLSYDIYVNENHMEDGDVFSGDSVHVIVKTNVCASNTINTETGEFTPAMEETATWIVTPQNIEVNVMMKALTDISILGYTGLQAVRGPYDKVYYNDGTPEKTITNVRIDSAVYPGFSGERAIMSTDDNEVYVLYTNRSVGLGNLSHLANNTPVSFVSAYDKLYQHLIKNSPLNLDTNEIAVYSGGFTIMPSYESTGAKSAYFIKLNGERIYCVDFLTSGNCYVSLPVECIGKQITVIEKTDTVTVGQIVTGDGLFVSSTGYGTLKFKTL